MTRTFARVALSAVLATGVGLAVGAPAFASSSSEHAASAPEGKKKKTKKPTIKVAKTDLGKILVTTKGNTLYIYDPDGTDTVSPKCVDACADAWPAYAPSRKPKVGKGLDASLAGIGGGGQATYNSRLLYEFSGDTAAGDTNGQDVGGVWHVVGADGEPITS
jgi:predicted lipoprotein with Yx(FWY)xxD motif